MSSQPITTAPSAPPAGPGVPPAVAAAEPPQIAREVRLAPPRYRNEIGKFSVRRSDACVNCGRCVELCPYGVHTRPEGYRFIVRPFDYRCIGPECAKTSHYCVAACPQGALSVSENLAFETLGDCRWTPDLLASTWVMAETGHAPGPHLESATGNSGGGFDKLRFRFPAEPPAGLRRDDVSTALLLNRRGDYRPKVSIDVPWYGGGMSFGSTNIHMLLGKVRAATAWNTFSCTGEGGYPERFIPYADHMITQVATGLFGVREETIQRARIVEFKYAQGAKPGLGGHLLGDKNTPAVAAMREAVVGTSLFSPFPFHSVYSVEDHKKHLDWIAHVNPRALLSAKVSTPTDVDMVAVGIYYAGAHPFIGMNEALVHNGDFANYHSVCEYLAQRNLFPQFLTDTEASVLLFDLLHRTYGYPVEYIIEALAPTTELDFDRLPEEKRRIYRLIQATHMHASPDGPWFFIIARSLAEQRSFQLLGITDTAMLRPQVFALQEGEVSIGLVCSEKQAIDATLAGLATVDRRFTPIADQYWNARGGSSSDGGAFLMTLSPADVAQPPSAVQLKTQAGAPVPHSTGHYTLRVTDKFGHPVTTPSGQVHCDVSVGSVPASISAPATTAGDAVAVRGALDSGNAWNLFAHLRDSTANVDYGHLLSLADEIASRTADGAPGLGIEALTLALDRRYPTGTKKRSSVLTILRHALERIFNAQHLITTGDGSTTHCRVTWATRDRLRGPQGGETTLLIDGYGFRPEGDECDARLAVAAFHLGWRHIVHYNTRGTRFHAAGFGPATDGLRVDCYDNPGDYLGSGMDGLEAHVHANAQDQLCQIAKRGKVVIHGDVGQTFLYGAKGGECYVMGNAAGRPLINAVGKPRVVINGTALDFLAESFMAGKPLEGGGFAVVNGLRFDAHGKVVPLDMPYPGSNLLSLASGGAIYVRDPERTLVAEQLNGGAFRRLSAADWKLIRPYLEENERLFGIEIERDLLTVDGVLRTPRDVYTKVTPSGAAEVEAELEGMGD